MKVYVLSSMIAAFAGVLYAFYLQYLDPSIFGWTKSSEWVIFLFFGGISSLTGSVISTIMLNILPEVLRFASDLRIVMYTLIIILVLNFRPQGLMGDRELSFKWLKFGRKKNDAVQNS
jgi:branched-chain amino acid transport system permease protein